MFNLNIYVMKLIKTKIKDLLILKSHIYNDNRGFLKETFRKNILKKIFHLMLCPFQKKMY